MSFEEFQGVGYKNGTILAILNIFVATMHPTWFKRLTILKKSKMWKLTTDVGRTDDGQQATA